MKIQPINSFSYKRKTSNISQAKPFAKTPLTQDKISFGMKDVQLKNWEVVDYFRAMNVRAKVRLDRTVSVWKYVPKKRDIEKLKSLGMDEETLFQYVTMVEGSVDLTHSELESLGAVREIGGYLITGTKLKDFGELIGIGDNLNMVNSPILDHKNLKFVGGDLLTDVSDVFNNFDMEFCVLGETYMIRTERRKKWLEERKKNGYA